MSYHPNHFPGDPLPYVRQYEGPSSEALVGLCRRLAGELRLLLAEAWDGHGETARLTGPETTLDFLEQWLTEEVFYDALSEARERERAFEEGDG